jgi:hypothetical protein
VLLDGIRISWSGLAKRASSCAAVWDLGERARFLVGRLERGSADVGMLSGICSDIVQVLWRPLLTDSQHSCWLAPWRPIRCEVKLLTSKCDRGDAPRRR